MQLSLLKLSWIGLFFILRNFSSDLRVVHVWCGRESCVFYTAQLLKEKQIFSESGYYILNLILLEQNKMREDNEEIQIFLIWIL